MVFTDAHIGEWLQLVRAEYLEIPGLRLTKPQVQQLWELDDTMSEAVLSALVDGKFLKRASHDTYVRADLS
jgi:hypothetical protein